MSFSADDNTRLDGLEAARLLKCSFKTLHRLVKIRKIEPVGTHKNLRNMEFRLGDLKRFMEERHEAPEAPQENLQTPPEATTNTTTAEVSAPAEPSVHAEPPPPPPPPAVPAETTQTPIEAQSEDTMKNAPKPNDNRIYTPTEALRLCGMPPGTFYGYVKRGRLKPVNVDGNNGYREIDLMHFMEFVANARAGRNAAVPATKPVQPVQAKKAAPKPAVKKDKPAATATMTVVIGDVLKLTEAEVRAIRLVFPQMNGEMKVNKSNILNFETLAALAENKGAFAKIVSGIKSGATVILTANE